jgi:predicted Na+-dependent transporter
MAQTRKHSFAESITNIFVGYTINLLANFVIFPLYGWELSLAVNIEIGVIYTVISLARSYCLRRIYNRYTG